LIEITQRGANAFDLHGLNALRHFIDQNEPRQHKERAGGKKHLLLATAERPGALIEALPQKRKRRKRASASLVEAGASPECNPEVLDDREIWEQRRFLRDVGDPLSRDLVRLEPEEAPAAGQFPRSAGAAP
jgi:hypothetical protein